MTVETIICAAIWYKELPTQVYPPKNIERGLVVCGHRHHNCIDIMKALANLRTVKLAPDGVGESEQGFLTNFGRFVGRLEALEIAKNANQIRPEELTNPRIGLFSEDLY